MRRHTISFVIIIKNNKVYRADLFKVMETTEDYKKIEIKTHFDNWKENHLHRQYLTDMKNKVDNKNT